MKVVLGAPCRANYPTGLIIRKKEQVTKKQPGENDVVKSII